MVIQPDDFELCGCGSHGCFERVVSKRRICAKCRQYYHQYPNSVLYSEPLETITVQSIFRASAAEDACARRIVEYLADCFSLLLRNISLVFDPDLVVFQGDYAYADEYFKKCLRDKLHKFKYFPEDGSFGIYYDKRPLIELDVIGASYSLQSMFFSDVSIYKDQE